MMRVALILGLLTGAALALGLLPEAAAHAPPNPRQHETRLLTDQNDDCGEHGSGGCQGTFDLLAVNVREAYDAPNETHVLVWALWMAPGAGQGTHSAQVSYKADGEDQSFTITGTAQDGFESEGSAWIRGPYPLLLGGEPDGDRFGIDVAVPRGDIAEDATLEGFQMEASVDDTVGDVMPGTFRREDGSLAPRGSAEEGEPAETRRPNYRLQGPTHYIDVRIDDPARGAIMIESRLSRTDQNVSVEVEPDTIGIREHDMEHTAEFDLPGGGFHGLTLEPQDGARTAHIIVTTDLGGFAELDLDFESSGDGTQDGGPAPGIGAAFVLATIAAAVIIGRRRP